MEHFTKLYTLYSKKKNQQVGILKLRCVRPYQVAKSRATATASVYHRSLSESIEREDHVDRERFRLYGCTYKNSY